MSARLLLARHAEHDLAGRALAGRMPGLGINAHGRSQAGQLAAALEERRWLWAIAAVYSSPQQRTRETAQPVAERLGLALRIAPEFDEIDFGDWTGKSFEELRTRDPARWQLWCERRSQAAAPGGEAFANVVARACGGVRRLAREHEGQVVLVVSHADVIRGVIGSQLGMSLDDLERLEISCAGLSELEVGEGWGRVLAVNSVL